MMRCRACNAIIRVIVTPYGFEDFCIPCRAVSDSVKNDEFLTDYACMDSYSEIDSVIGQFNLPDSTLEEDEIVVLDRGEESVDFLGG